MTAVKQVFRCPTYKVKLPRGTLRVETGVVRFNDDWPGIFLRGDYAAPMAMHLRELLDKLPKSDWVGAGMVESLAETLESCNTNGLPLE